MLWFVSIFHYVQMGKRYHGIYFSFIQLQVLVLSKMKLKEMIINYKTCPVIYSKDFVPYCSIMDTNFRLY